MIGKAGTEEVLWIQLTTTTGGGLAAKTAAVHSTLNFNPILLKTGAGSEALEKDVFFVGKVALK